MLKAWQAYDEFKIEFDDTDFSTDDPWQRHEAREKLYELYDIAVEVSTTNELIDKSFNKIFNNLL